MTTRIGFSTPKGFNPVSWAVRTLTGSPASHAFFIYHDRDWDCDCVLEAHELGFRLVSLEQFEKRNEIVATFNPCYPIDVGVASVAREFIGSIYDFGGLIGFVFVMVGRWFRRKLRNPLASHHALICSESIVLALQRSKYPEAETLDLEGTSPQDLLKFFTAESKTSS